MRGSGVYVLRDAQGHSLYVGQSVSLDDRLSYHLSGNGWRKEIASIQTAEYNEEISRICAERALIRNLKPLHNKMHAWLPSDEELEVMHYVWMPNWFYDGVKIRFSIESDDALAEYLKVTPHHIKIVRLGLMGPTSQEMFLVAGQLNIAYYQLKKVLPKMHLHDRDLRKHKQKELRVSCKQVSIVEILG